MMGTVEQNDSADKVAAGGDPQRGGTGACAGIGIFSGLGAVAAKSCCVLPLLLASSGLGGAWISRALLPYQPYFIATAWLAVALAWVLAIRRRRAACAPGEPCHRGRAGWVSYALLAFSTFIVGLASAWERIEPAAMAALIRLTEGGA